MLNEPADTQNSLTFQNIQEQNTTYRLLSKTFILLLHHARREHFNPLVDMLLAELDDLIADVEKTKEQSNNMTDVSSLRMAGVLAMLAICVTVRKASRISSKAVA